MKNSTGARIAALVLTGIALLSDKPELINWLLMSSSMMYAAAFVCGAIEGQHNAD